MKAATPAPRGTGLCNLPCDASALGTLRAACLFLATLDAAPRTRPFLTCLRSHGSRARPIAGPSPRPPSSTCPSRRLANPSKPRSRRTALKHRRRRPPSLAWGCWVLSGWSLGLRFARQPGAGSVRDSSFARRERGSRAPTAEAGRPIGAAGTRLSATASSPCLASDSCRRSRRRSRGRVRMWPRESTVNPRVSESARNQLAAAFEAAQISRCCFITKREAP